MNIGIIGFGLIGGSLAKAIKKVHAQNSYIIGYDKQLTYTKAAYEEGVIDSIAMDTERSFSNCAVIFICTPVSYTCQTIEKLLPHVANDCIITDVGSTKYNLVCEIDKLIKQTTKRIYYVGGHPMAGSEKSGYGASTPYLFENAYYMLTPMGDTPEFILFILQKMIERIGAIPLVLSASYHDFATANISHIPHIVASSLVHLVKDNDGDSRHLHALAAGGFKDITRIASSNPDIWTSICLSNKQQIKKVFNKYVSILSKFSEALDLEDENLLYCFFDTARIYRNTFSEGASNDVAKSYALHIDVKDEPGIIASIATLLSANHLNIKNIGIVNDREFESGVIKIVFESKSSMLRATEILSQHKYNIYY
ncbi:prephenate dehydrogenase/arogenate dehydrogenase family protein [Cellulosilyticum sp. I15G10I2]|uniref:prephenate dehydrogenase/arogenate dehydrogenase family protein n=1 Tax=Cellulosilyticum sp. I15G10I2 TaxID=1892843 RepID=UPI00085C8A42|nr:prephenate dehydrogenase/arogenate dehydrogenase family protein [Cellulosilyticum sp. I15G10I2]